MGTGIRSDDEFQATFSEIMDEVINKVSERAYNLLITHIENEVYNTGANRYYKPTFEFRDKAWVKTIKAAMGDYVKTYVSDIVYTPSRMKPPDIDYPLRHGYYTDENHTLIDNREILADLLNVEGKAQGIGDKQRHLFWDNYERELSEKMGQWLYTEFNYKGIKIPALKFLKPERWYK